MGLFKIAKDFAGFFNLVSDSQISDVVGSMEYVEKRYAERFLGKDQYRDLETKYQASPGVPLTPPYATLLKEVRKVVGPITGYYASPKIILQIGSGGIQTQKSEHMAIASDSKISNMRKSSFAIGLGSIDYLLDFLEEFIADYPLYAVSKERLKFKSLFVPTAIAFDKYWPIDESRWTYMKLFSIICDVEENYIKKYLCDDLYAEIKTELETDAVTVLNQKVIDRIKPALVNLVINKAIVKLPVDFSNGNLSITESPESDEVISKKVKVPGSYMDEFLNRSRIDANHFVSELVNFLNNNADDYPLYKNSACFVDPEQENTTTNHNVCETPGAFIA